MYCSNRVLKIVPTLGSAVIYTIIYCISTVNTQQMQRPDVSVQLGDIWRHVSAVKLPSSGQQRIVLL